MNYWNQTLRHCCALVLLASLVACGAAVSRDSSVENSKEDSREDPLGGPAVQPAAGPKEVSSPAVSGTAKLLEQAQQERAAGHYDNAIALLERGLRITPNDAAMYLALADIYADSGDLQQAQAMAQRGMLYCRQSDVCRSLQQFMSR